MALRTIGTKLDQIGRNDLNQNFADIDAYIKAVQAEITRVESETKTTIDGIVGGGFIEGLELAKNNANTAATTANEKAGYANTQGTYAKTQGDHAKTQGDYALSKGNYANEKAVLANEAATNANQEASNLDAMKIAAVDATQAANTAATQANTARDSANTAAQAAATATLAADAATVNADTAADNANEKAGLAQTAADNANAATLSVNDAKEAANTAATNANEKAGLADTAATAANEAAGNADTATQEAQTATTAANDAANAANTATTNADAATSAANEAAGNANAATEAANTAAGNAQAVADNTRHMGTFNLDAFYEKNNEVEENGSSYRAKQDTQGNPLPSSPSKENDYWVLSAQRGVDGEGSVSSVNGVSPDLSGNVQLTPANIGVHTHANKNVLDGLTDNAGQLEYKGSVVGSVTSVNGETGEITGLETTTGAQEKADAAEANAKAQLVDHKAINAVGAHNASNISLVDVSNQFTSEDVEGALGELFLSLSNGNQSVSNGKTEIAAAITEVDDSLTPTGSDTFLQLANTIRSMTIGPEPIWEVGDEVILASEGEVAETTSGAWIIKKEIKVDFSSAVRIKYELKATAASQAYANIRINGVARGTQRTATGASYVTFTEDITVTKGDLVQIYIYVFSGATGWIRNFKICVQDVPTLYGTVNL